MTSNILFFVCGICIGISLMILVMIPIMSKYHNENKALEKRNKELLKSNELLSDLISSVYGEEPDDFDDIF